MLFNVTVKRRKSWLLAASALASSSLGVSEPALAACSAGPAVVCTAGNYTSIDVTGGPTQALSITLEPAGVAPGVVVTPISGGVNAVNAANWTNPTLDSANIFIAANGGAQPVIINNAAFPGSNNVTGLRIQSSGNATITATNTTIDVAGTASDWAILAFAMPQTNNIGPAHVASVNWSGPHLSSSGNESGGIQADNRGNGDAIVVASGDITVVPNAGLGTTQYGLLAHAGDPFFVPAGAGSAFVTFNSGTIDVSAVRPRGILAWADGIGSATVNTGAGTVIKVSGTQFGGPGVYVFSSTATAPNALTANVASLITSSGPPTTDPNNLPVGIRANNSGTNAPIFVTYTGPGITTTGGNGSGVLATSGSGSIIVNASGPINTTDGSNAVGIRATTTGSVQVNATNVTTRGEFGNGISATAGSGGVTVNIPSGGSVMGRLAGRPYQRWADLRSTGRRR
jgi:hypothetical protein